MKKIISVILAIAILSVSVGVVFAENSVKISAGVDKTSVTVSVTTDILSGVTLKVYQLTQQEDGTYKQGALVHVDQRETPDTLNTYVFPVFHIHAGATSGKYRVVINNEYTYDFIYTKQSDKIAVYQAIESASYNEMETVLAEGVKNNTVIFDLGDYFSYSASIKKLMNQALEALALPVLTEDAADSEIKAFEIMFQTEFTRLLQAADLFSAEEEQVKETVARAALVFDFDLTYYDNTNEEFLTSLSDRLCSATPNSFSDQDIEKAFGQAALLALLGNVDNGTLTECLEYFSGKIITLDTTYTDDFTEVEKNKVSQKLNRSASSIHTIKDLEEKYFDFSKEIAENKESGGSGSSGGGGGSGSGGTSSPKPYTPTTPVDPAPTTPEKIQFSDLNEAEWAREAIEYLVSAGVLAGKGDGKFYPNDTVTREELVKIAVESFDLTCDGAKASFTDVEITRWSYAYIAVAFELGIVNGISETEFAPTGNMTRENMAVILYRLADYLNIALTEETTVTFLDENQISDYAKEAVTALANAGIVNGMGDGTFAPKATVTRAQAAKMVYGLLTLAGGVE